MKVFASWSGGKDCTLATYKAVSQGHEVSYLLNFISEDGERSSSHGVKSSVLDLQAKAIGIPILQVKTSWESYEENFKKAIKKLKERGIEGGVFGDIYLAEHREWIERVCSEMGIQAILPLWGSDTANLMAEFIGLGFTSILVATKLDETFLGKTLNEDLVNQLTELGSDPCGEGGEYHSFVNAGPLFHKKLKITEGEKEQRDDTWFMDISVEIAE